MTKVEKLSLALQRAEKMHANHLKQASTSFELLQAIRAELLKEFSTQMNAAHLEGTVTQQLVHDLCSKAHETDLGSFSAIHVMSQVRQQLEVRQLLERANLRPATPPDSPQQAASKEEL